MKNKNASELGKLAKGKPKKFSKAELEKRRVRMAVINERRAKKK